MKNKNKIFGKKNLPVIILDVITWEEKMSPGEEAVKKRLNEGDELHDKAIDVFEVKIYDKVNWIAKFKKEDGEAYFALFNQDLSRYKTGYEGLFVEGDYILARIENKIIKITQSTVSGIDWNEEEYKEEVKVTPEKKKRPWLWIILGLTAIITVFLMTQ